LFGLGIGSFLIVALPKFSGTKETNEERTNLTTEHLNDCPELAQNGCQSKLQTKESGKTLCLNDILKVCN